MGGLERTWEDGMVLDELLKNELNHEEPPWRTPVNRKDDEIEWRMKKNKINSYDDIDGGSD